VLIWTAIIRPLVAIAVLALLSSCSAVKLAYTNLPELGYWWIDGYADLGDSQSVQLRADLTGLQEWHRATELIKVAELLQQISRNAQADTTAQQVCRLFDQVRERVDAVRVQSEPTAVLLAMSFSPTQIGHMESKLEKSNAEWRRKWATGDRAEQQKKRVEASVERAEQFYGTLDDRQRAVLRAGMAASSFDPQRSFAQRLRRQQDLLQTLRTLSGANGTGKPPVAQAGAMLSAYLDRAVQSPDPAYQAYAQAAIQDSCQTYAQLHNSTNAQQRTRAIARFAAYERDARELARQP